jgi:hypothetical protein
MQNINIAAILIAITLVVGVTLAVTTQSAFAYSNKKKGDEGNSKSNTITIQKCKQDGTQSGHDNSFEQECQNLIRIHPIIKTCEQCFTRNLYDNFEGGTYTLSADQISPNGKWIDIFNGFGSAGVRDDGTGSNKVFFMYPATSTSPDETHANLVSFTQKFSDFELSIDAKTIQQLRQNSPPNSWEAATIFFRQTDIFHYYAFVLKTDGIEFDKKDCNTCTDPAEGQQFLVTRDSPTLKIDSWSNWRITAIGNHITITVDGNKVIDYIDQTMSPQLSSGAVAMYDEDAYVNFDNVYITPKKACSCSVSFNSYVG